MALQSIKGLMPWPPPPYGVNGNISTGSLSISAINEQVAGIFIAPKAGSIAKIGFRTRTVTTSALCDFRLEGVDLTKHPATPNGTLLTANAVATGVNLNASNTWFEGSLTANHTVARGDLVAVVCKGPSSGSPNLNIATLSEDLGHDIPYAATHNGTSWNFADRVPPCCQVEYSDGSYAYIPHLWPFEGAAANAFNSTSTNNRRGLRFKLPFSCSVGGFWFWLESLGDWTGQLFADATDATGTPLAEVTGADGPGDLGFGGEGAGSSKDQVRFIIFDADVELTKGSWYRIVVKPENASGVTLYRIDVTAAALMDSLNGGQDCYETQWNTGGTPAWENTATGKMFGGVLISQLDDGVGGGGGGGSINRGIMTGGRL